MRSLNKDDSFYLDAAVRSPEFSANEDSAPQLTSSIGLRSGCVLPVNVADGECV